MKTRIPVKTSLLIFLSIFVCIHMHAQDVGLSPKKFMEKGNALHGIFIDVRTPEEFLTATIPGAINISFMSPDFKTVVMKLDKTKAYFIFSGAGIRSSGAMSEMKKMGFYKIYELEGGLLSWQRDKMPID